jgi:hypothetical protein
MVSITFELEKRDIRNDTISHQSSGDSLGMGEMCPVHTAAEIILRIHSYGIPNEQINDTPINVIKLGSLSYTISSSLILVKIRTTIQHLGFKKLGFHPDEVGTHSNQLGRAMGIPRQTVIQESGVTQI